MNVALRSQSSGYCHWRGAGKNVFVGRLPASKSQDGMAAVVASGGEYDGGNLAILLTTELTINKSRCA